MGGQPWNCEQFDHFIPSPACRNHCQSWKPFSLLQDSLGLGWLQCCSPPSRGWPRVVSPLPLGTGGEEDTKMDEGFPQRRVWEPQRLKWKVSGSSGTHDCSGGHHIPGDQRVLLCPTLTLSCGIISSSSPESLNWVLPSWLHFPHVTGSHECSCCSATKNGDTGYKNIAVR